MSETLSVSAIQEGTVIDHIAAGKALKILKILPYDTHLVTVGLNLKSASMGLKDLIKVEQIFLTPSQAAEIAIFSPQATVNVIQNFKIVKKFPVALPAEILGIFHCPNKRCVTRHEKTLSRFSIETGKEVFLKCHYCDHQFPREAYD